MGMIEDQARPQIKKRITFSDGYEWETDFEGNHRLYNLDTGHCTIWLKSNSLAVLDDRMVLPEFFKGLDVPVESILHWQRFPAIETKTNIIT